MKRLFAAVKIHPSDSLMTLYYRLKNELKNEKITWVDPKNIHVTLKFFGETEESRIPEINKVLSEVATHHGAFRFQLEGMGVFGSSYNPRVIWLGIKQDKALRELSEEVLNAVVSIGWPLDRQNFVPHLTLGRIKYIQDKERLKQIVGKNKEEAIQQEQCNAFHLFESILKPSGPDYIILQTFSLQ